MAVMPPQSRFRWRRGGGIIKYIDLISYPSSPELMNHYFHVCAGRIDKALSVWSGASDD